MDIGKLSLSYHRAAGILEKSNLWHVCELLTKLYDEGFLFYHRQYNFHITE